MPRLRLNSDVSFVFDTGADSTLLTPMDALRMGVDYASLSNRGVMQGVGGIGLSFTEPALVTFRGVDATLYVYEITLTIAAPDPDS